MFSKLCKYIIILQHSNNCSELQDTQIPRSYVTIHYRYSLVPGKVFRFASSYMHLFFLFCDQHYHYCFCSCRSCCSQLLFRSLWCLRDLQKAEEGTRWADEADDENSSASRTIATIQLRHPYLRLSCLYKCVFVFSL